MEETIRYLNSLLNDLDTLVIGLSGGPDSMCLLNIIMSLNKKLNIICAHINHGIRKESIKEKDFIIEYCQKNNLIIETTTFSKKSKNQDYNELELREKRYEFFEKIIKKYNAKYLFTAHHGYDLIETILMRISRGSNLKGYSGFQIDTPKEGYRIIKPLIYMTKEEIENYNKKNNIPYVIDKTNLEDNYTRNRYRHNIIPFLTKENTNIHLKYLKFSNELNKYYEFVNNLVLQEINKRYKDKVLDITDFNKIDDLLKTKIIEYILDDNYDKNLYLVSDKHINIILDIITNPKPNIIFNLPDNLKIIKEYNKLKLTRDNSSSSKSYTIILEDVTLLPNGRQIKKISSTLKNTNDYIRLNSKELSLPLIVRTRKDGDKITIKNMQSPKKIKDIFIDCKLTKEQRDTQPIVTDSSGEIIWLPSLKKSKFAKAKSELYDIILWYN